MTDAEFVRKVARPLSCDANDYNQLLKLIGDARIVLLGEGHYFHARLPKQFDVIIHIDETQAVEPLERTSIWDKGELPETYPFNV